MVQSTNQPTNMRLAVLPKQPHVHSSYKDRLCISITDARLIYAIKAVKNAIGYSRDTDTAFNLILVGLKIYEQYPKEFLGLLSI